MLRCKSSPTCCILSLAYLRICAYIVPAGATSADTWWRYTFFLVTVPDQNRFRPRCVHRNVAPSAVVITLSILASCRYLTLVRLQENLLSTRMT